MTDTPVAPALIWLLSSVGKGITGIHSSIDPSAAMETRRTDFLSFFQHDATTRVTVPDVTARTLFNPSPSEQPSSVIQSALTVIAETSSQV